MSRKKPPGVCKPVATKSGTSWRAVLSLGRRPDGSRDQRRVSDRTEDGCEAKARKLLVERDEWRLADAGGLTVGRYLLERWLPAKEATGGVKPATARRYEQAIRGHILPALGRARLDRVSETDVERLLIDRAAVLGPAHLRLVWAVLNGALRRAARLRLIPRNPCDGVDPPSPPADRPYPAWSAGEQRAFLAAADRDEDAALWRLLLLGGLRVGEALTLRWGDVAPDGGAVTVQRTLTLDRDGRRRIGTSPKSPSGEREVSLAPSCAASLRSQRDRAAVLRRTAGGAWHPLDLVFPGADGRWRAPEAVADRLARVCQSAGVPPLTPHGLRHSHGTQLMRSGVHPKVAQRRLGHGSVEMAMKYAHAADEDQREAAARVAAALGDAGGDTGAADRG